MRATCPKCAVTAQRPEAICPNCGLVYAKYDKRAAEPKPPPKPVKVPPKPVAEPPKPRFDTPAPKPEPAEKNIGLAIGLNIVLPGLGYAYMGRYVLALAALALAAMFYWGDSGGGYLFLIVIMSLDMMILQGKRKAQEEQGSRQACPHCAERIRVEAKICRFCDRPV